ncbi:MAG: hypothetical protein KBA33_04185 [Cloacibacterium sp.]|nr:hypothetical protein [Cloacibacterium sp.]
MEDSLNNIRNRPRFKLQTHLSQQEYEQNLRAFYKQNRKDFSANINSEMATIKVRTKNDEFWKPRLSMRIEHDEELNATIIRGIFGPSNAVWTFFMFLYIMFFTCFTIFISIYYVTKQINSPDFPWALEISIASLVCIGLTYLAARIGQMKAKTEMQKLREFAEQSISSL